MSDFEKFDNQKIEVTQKEYFNFMAHQITHDVVEQVDKKLDKLGTETAFSISAEANAWKKKGNKVYPFHLGDLNLKTPRVIREKTNYYMNKNKNSIVTRIAPV